MTLKMKLAVWCSATVNCGVATETLLLLEEFGSRITSLWPLKSSPWLTLAWLWPELRPHELTSVCSTALAVTTETFCPLKLQLLLELLLLKLASMISSVLFSPGIVASSMMA